MRHLFLALTGALLLNSCGYVGDPLPPALKTPKAVADLEARQVGPSLEIKFTLPDKTLEGLDLPALGAVELKVGPSPVPFNAEAWSSSARVVDVAARKPEEVTAKVPVADWAGQEVTIGVRSANPKLRISPWSNFVRLKVVPVVETPKNVRALATAAGVQLEWEDGMGTRPVEWKLYRQGAKDAEPIELASVKERKYVDSGAEYDVDWKYTIVASEGAATGLRSEPVTIRPEDKFPPSAPQGLSALATASAIQLSWERNTEPDIAGYRIYRAFGSGLLVKIAESTGAANYRDDAVSSRGLYRYMITAFDKKGNESPKSQVVEISAP